MVNSKLRNKFEWHPKRNSQIFIQENAFENVVCEMAVILSQPQCGITIAQALFVPQSCAKPVWCFGCSRFWIFVSQHQAITWTNVDLTSHVRSAVAVIWEQFYKCSLTHRGQVTHICVGNQCYHYNKMPALVQIMTWYRPGYKPFIWIKDGLLVCSLGLY